MPRHNKTNQNNQEKITKSVHCKIRKRVSSSSSTTSSTVVKNYHSSKRVILVGKRVIMAGSKSPMQNFENGVKYGKNGISSDYYGNKRKESVSARQLAANLWEINEMHSPKQVKNDIFEEKRGRKSSESSDKYVGKLFDGQKHLFLDQFPHHSPVSEKFDGSKVKNHRRRSSSASQKLQITEYMSGGLEAVGRASSIEASNLAFGENNHNVRRRLKDVNNSLIASKELVKVLFRIIAQEEQQSSRLTLVSALRVELDRARLQVDQLIQEQRYSSEQFDALLKQFSEEKAVWKSKEKQKIKEAISSLTKEVEIERKQRRQTERLNKKLGLELANTRTHFERAMKELDGETRAREILEQTCDELARGIGEERVEVEELKKESEKAREEVQKEREMFQLADVLREERVQMKLSEARYEYEEKNEALERLRNELEIYLKPGDGQENGETTSPYFDGIDDFNDFLKTMQQRSFQVRGMEQDEQSDGGDDSVESELHSIELSMDNKNKWSFGCDGINQGDSRRPSVEEVFKGRRSLSEKIQWENICLQKTASNGLEWEFNGGNKPGNIKEKLPQLCENVERNERVDEFKKLASFHGSDSPAISTGKSSCLREACSEILKDLAAKRDQFVGSKR
ncbi:uncharacterized protein LOC141591634 [Silene latifolia]|uniref:uncharacterized protein LOC141591634 n=1 Tax=Silene latifolia TaxID=37657 RepID=UPI003D785A97